MAKAKKKGLSSTQKVGIGVSLTTAAVAAAGAYFLYGSKDAPKNRKTVKSWALKAKAEVLETLEKAQHMTEAEYQVLVDGAMKTYSKAQSLSKADVSGFKKEMSENWQGLVKSGAAKILTAEQIAMKMMKKPTKKKAAPKATKAARTGKKKASAKKLPKKAVGKPAKKAAKKAPKKK